jgi:UDP-glucose 4-epimerase
MKAADGGRVLVTGGAGRLGRHVVEQLRGAGWDVVVADLAPGAGELRCDVLDIDQVRAAVAGASAVCHLAGLDYDTASAEQDFVAVNSVGTWNVLQAASEHGVHRVVLASSVCAYGLLDTGPEWRPRYLPIDEQHRQRPRDGYSVSKHVVEEMGHAWARRGLSVICLQPMHVVFPGAAEPFLEFARSAPPEWLHQYVIADDAAAAFVCAVEVDGVAFETVLVSAAESPLATPTLDWYRDHVAALPPVLDPGLYAANPRASLFSTAKARELLGWTPRLTLADIGAELPVPVAR